MKIARKKQNDAAHDGDCSRSTPAAITGGIQNVTQEWFTREQMRIRFGVSIRTIDNWMQDGTLPYLKLGGVVRFNIKDCDAALRRFYGRPRWFSENEDLE